MPETTDAERTAVFIRSYERPESSILETIRKEALETGVPVIRPEAGRLLSFFTEMTAPKRVLEVGCAVGYSALLMLESMPEDGTILTIEHDGARAEKARENFRRAGKEDRISLTEGDAGEILAKLEGSFDLVFMDAAKAQYITWLPDVKRLLAPGGLLISDNILQEGDILEAKSAVSRRDRTIHKRMREYLEALTGDPELHTMLVPLGDGMAVTRKRTV